MVTQSQLNWKLADKLWSFLWGSELGQQLSKHNYSNRGGGTILDYPRFGFLFFSFIFVTNFF